MAKKQTPIVEAPVEQAKNGLVENVIPESKPAKAAEETSEVVYELDLEDKYPGVKTRAYRSIKK